MCGTKKYFGNKMDLLNSCLNKCEKSLETSSLLDHINFEFLFCLHLFCETLHELQIVSDYLQKSDSDLSSSFILVNALILHLNEYRNDIEKFKTQKLVRTKKLPANLAYYLTETISESRKIQNNDNLRLMIFYPVIDRISILDFAKLLDNYKMAFSETFILCC
ncbi:hypothetical protein QTP88_024344 [Uroleucon formosanum]